MKKNASRLELTAVTFISVVSMVSIVGWYALKVWYWGVYLLLMEADLHIFDQKSGCEIKGLHVFCTLFSMAITPVLATVALMLIGAFCVWMKQIFVGMSDVPILGAAWRWSDREANKGRRA